MSEKKKSHGVQLLIRAVVRDPDGKVLSDTGQKPSKSFVIQFLEAIKGVFKSEVTDITDVSGAEEIIYNPGLDVYRQIRIDATVNDDDYGIVLGTGDTAKTNTDYKLETQLTEGVGAGNISHGAMDMGTVAVVNGNVDIEYKRSFPNNTGSTITVKEAGIYSEWNPTVGDDQHHCLIRDVLETSIELPDKCALTVYYTYRTTV